MRETDPGPADRSVPASRRPLDAGSDHVPGGADPGAFPGEAIDRLDQQSGPARYFLEDELHSARVEVLAGPVALAERSERAPVSEASMDR